jgi:hypothetical protein
MFLALSFGGPYLSFHFDEAAWAYIGRAWFGHGLKPYLEAFDNKTPGIFILYGISYSLFEVNIWFPRVIASLALAGTAVTVTRLCMTVSGNNITAILSGTIFICTVSWKSFGWRYLVETESFVIFFVTLAYWFLCRYDKCRVNKMLILSGLMIGFAIAFKQTAILSLFAVMIVMFFVFRVQLRECFLFCVSTLFAYLVISFPVLLSKVSLTDYLYHTWILIFFSGGAGPVDYSLPWRLNGFLQAFFMKRIVLFYPLFLYALVKLRPWIEKRFWLLLLTWLGVEFIALNASGSYATHHFRLLAPPLAIIAAMIISDLLRNLQRYANFLRPPIAVTLVVIIWFPYYPQIPINIQRHLKGEEVPEETCHINGQFPSDGQRRWVGRWIKRNTHEDDYIFVAGASAAEMIYSERISSSRFFSTFPIPQHMEVHLKKDLEAKPPRVVLVPSYSGYRLCSSNAIRQSITEFLIAKKYEQNGCLNGYDIYWSSQL